MYPESGCFVFRRRSGVFQAGELLEARGHLAGKLGLFFGEVVLFADVGGEVATMSDRRE
jgi:hypothetical protein